MKKFIYGILMVMAGAGLLQAKDAGSASAQFLSIQPGARANGMGEVGVSLVDDASSMYWNPAGLADAKSAEVNFSHMIYFQSLNHDFAVFCQPIGRLGTLSVSGTALYSGAITKTTEDTAGNFLAEDGSFDTMESVISVGYGYKVTQNCGIGVDFKSIRQRIGDMSASGFASDVGLKYSVSDAIGAGFAVQNIGSAIKGDALPTNVKAGFHVKQFKNIIGLEANLPIAGSISYGAGVEYGVIAILSLRIGYNNRSDVSGMSGLHAGIGFNLKGVGVDYAFVPYGDIGMSHIISVGMKY